MYKQKGEIMIRTMTASDTSEVTEMMRVFYSSPAVNSNGSEEIFKNDVAACVGDCPFLEGLIFTDSADSADIAGYAMLAKSFSTEFGMPCVWVEDIYIKPEHRGKGFGKELFAYLERNYPTHAIRLEVEEENENAVGLYKKCGFKVLPYMEMIKTVDGV